MIKTFEERFYPKIEAKEDGCWSWIACLTKAGYGLFYDAGIRNRKLAHRVSYERFVGTIPDGLQLDHLCRNRACVNPFHLEPVTNRQNILRGETIQAARAAQTHCIHGHAYDLFNTYIRPDGNRDCKQCMRDRYSPEKRHAKYIKSRLAHSR